MFSKRNPFIHPTLESLQPDREGKQDHAGDLSQTSFRATLWLL